MGISLLTQDGATATASSLPTSFIIRTKKLEKFRLGSGGHSKPSHLYKIVSRASVEPQPRFYIDLSYRTQKMIRNLLNPNYHPY